MWNSRVEDLVKLALSQFKNSTNQARKKEMEKRIDYYEDKQLEYLEAILKRQFQNPDQLKLQMNNRNIVKRIVDKISLLYNSPPTRKILTGAKSKFNEKLTKQIQEEIWIPAELDNVCSTSERLMNLCRMLGVKVSFRNDKINNDIYAPDNLDVVQNAEDPTLADAIIYQKRKRTQTVTNKETIEYYVWSAMEHFKLAYYGGILRKMPVSEDNREMVNPYGVILFAWYRYDSVWRTFFNEGGYDLITAQENLDVQLTDLNEMIKMQAWSVPVITGDKPTTPIIIDRTNPYYAENKEDDFRFESPTPKLKDTWTIIKELVESIATDYDIAPGSFTLTKAPRSGIELKLENIGLYERAWRKRTFALAFERHLWELTKIVYKTQMPKGIKIPDDAKLMISFDDARIPEDPKKETEIWEWKFRWGIATPIDFLMSQNPNLTVEQAKLLYEGNLTTNKDLGTRHSTLGSLFKGGSAGKGDTGGEPLV